MATLEGKRALITGAGGGMGQSHAVLMAKRGAEIIIHDIKDDGAEETADMVREQGAKATVVIADIRDIRTFTSAISTAGPVDILVNNAGVGGARRMVEEITEQVFNLNGLGRLLVDSVLYGDYNTIQALVILIVAVFVLVNFIIDLSYAWLDPRIRYS